MPHSGIPDDLVDLLTTDRLGHVSSIRPDGSIATYVMWIDSDGQRILTSSPVGSRKGRNWRVNPRVGLSVVDRDDPFRYLAISGLVIDFQPDTNLAFIDKLSRRYLGSDYGLREGAREIFVIEPERVRASRGRRR